MSDTWSEWDKSLSAIASIESNARWISIHVSRLENAVSALESVPVPAVGPDEELASAEQGLLAGLNAVRAARAKYAPAKLKVA